MSKENDKKHIEHLKFEVSELKKELYRLRSLIRSGEAQAYLNQENSNE